MWDTYIGHASNKYLNETRMWGICLENPLYGAPIRAMYVINTYMGQLLYMVQVCEEYLYGTRIWDM